MNAIRTLNLVAQKSAEIPLTRLQHIQRPVAYNVLFLIDRLSEMGGAELALSRLVRELATQGIQTHVVTFSEEICSELRMLFACPIEVFPLRRTYDYSALQVARQVRSLIVRKQICLVHTFFETSDLFGGLITRSVPGVALITSRRDMGILRRRKHRLAYPILSRLAHRIVTVSEKVREWCIVADCLPPDRVITVYNGAQAMTCSRGVQAVTSRGITLQSLGLSHDQVIVTAIGNIRHVKGYDVLVEAAALTLRAFPHVVFLVAGAEHEEGRLRQLEALVKERKIQSNVRFLGSMKDISSLLQASDIFLLPSRSEGFSNALIEAMSAGLPCIATDVGGNAEAVLPGVSGIVVPSENPEAMSSALADLLSSEDLRRSMGDEGRRIAHSRFTHAAMMCNMLAVYRSALHASGYSTEEIAGNAQTP